MLLEEEPLLVLLDCDVRFHNQLLEDFECFVPVSTSDNECRALTCDPLSVIFKTFVSPMTWVINVLVLLHALDDLLPILQQEHLFGHEG